MCMTNYSFKASSRQFMIFCSMLSRSDNVFADWCRLCLSCLVSLCSPVPSRRTALRGLRASATPPASPHTTSSLCRASSARGTSSSVCLTAPSPTRCTAPPLTSPPPLWLTARLCHPGTRAKVRPACSKCIHYRTAATVFTVSSLWPVTASEFRGFCYANTSFANVNL